MNKKVSVILVLIVLAGVGVMAMKKGPSSALPSNSEMTKESSKSASETVAAKDGMITVESSSFKFVPNAISVKKGVKTKLVLNNVDGMHDFVVDDLAIKTKIVKGAGQDTVEFTADKAGSYEFYCSVGNHKAMGMVGTLVVEE